MNVVLLLAAVVIIACVICNRISSKFGIPMLLAFILLGMFFGSDGVIRIPFDNFHAAEDICSVALIVIMFYGGLLDTGNRTRGKLSAGGADQLDGCGVRVFHSAFKAFEPKVPYGFAFGG